MSTAFEKYQQIEIIFNKNYLKLLQQLLDMTEPDPEDEDETLEHKEKAQEQHEWLEIAYSKYYDIFIRNAQAMDGCSAFYKTVENQHELLLARDENLFETEQDFFASVFGEENIDSFFLYNELSDGTDTDDPIANDAKSNLWDTLIGLYRLAVLRCTYLKMPIVKEIIDMILMDNPDLNQFNLTEKIFQDFKKKAKLRKLITKLLKSKTDNFADIFSSLQKVVSSFSSECNNPKAMQASMEAAQAKTNVAFNDILTNANVSELKQEDKDSLKSALTSKDKEVKQSFIQRNLMTSKQLVRVETEFFAQNLHQSQNVNKTVQDLGATMKKLMSAVESNSEEEMKKVFDECGGDTCFNGIDMSKFQQEMESELDQEVDEDSEEESSAIEESEKVNEMD